MFTKDYFKGIRYWNRLTEGAGGKVIYGGDGYHKRSDGVEVIPFAMMSEFL